jgi:hypothetical protein
MAEENNLGLMLTMGRSVLDLARVPSLEEIYYQIDEINAFKLRDIAQEMFDEKKMSYLIMEPDKNMNGNSSH